MPRTALYLMLLFILHHAHAQIGEGLTFEQETHDFGEIDELGGPVEHKFTFTNSSENPVKITNVKASCGCTTPDWTKDEIAPGGQGFIQARYNPANRPGPFNKSLTITTNQGNEPYRLYIKGSVKPKPRTPEDDFPVVMGNIRVESQVINFGRMKVNLDKSLEMSLKREKKLAFYNASEESVSLTGEIVGPSHIALVNPDLTIPPKEEGEIILSYDTESFTDLGYRSDNIVIQTTDKTQSGKEFYVVATIEEYFPPMSAAEKEKAPRLFIDTRFQDMGKIKPGEKVKAEYILTNNGKTELDIRQITPNCECIRFGIESNTIAPGESLPLIIEMDGETRPGIQQKAVTIYCNDPVNPTQMISIRARVEG